MKIYKRLIIISLDKVKKKQKKLQVKNKYLIQNSAKMKLNKLNLIPRRTMYLFIQMKGLQNSR